MRKFLLFIILFFIHTLSVSAADVSVRAPETVDTPTIFSVMLTASTDGNLINSVEISLAYPKDIITFKGYKEDNSIKKIWIVPPTDTDGVVHFSGIIPGGVDGVYNPDTVGLQPIPLVELLFSPKNNGVGDFTITHSDILQNNGKGTPLAHENKNSSIRVFMSESASLDTSNSSTDIVPPEPFTIEYIPSGLFAETPSMISFSATDTLTGIDKYQIKTVTGMWKDIHSPSPIQKGILERTVTIRALDFAGNSRESTVEIPGILSIMQLFYIVIFCITCYFMFFVVKKRR